MASPTSLSPQRLFAPADIGNSVGTLYTSTSVTTQIQGIWLCNHTTASVTVTLYAVPSGGSAQDSNAIVKDLPIGPKGYVKLDVGGAIYLASGGTLQAVASAATSVSVFAGGVQIA